MKSLFITGASGFIGRRLLNKLDLSRYDTVYCLTRNETNIQKPVTDHQKLRVVQGGIYDSKVYAPYLSSCHTVVHLAAATGKVDPEEYFTVNAQGTQVLTDQCQKAGVKNLLHVSTIAVKYPDKSNYHYAQSKELGEETVKNSGLNYTIVRPTIVIGQDAAILKSLSKLVQMPVTLMFGKGTVKIQPIYIEDLIDCLLYILGENIFSNEVFELGGPEEITFEKFLKKIHSAYFGDEPKLVIHLPLKPLTSFLSLLEKRFYSKLPVNAGQLSAFGNEGTIQVNRIFRHHGPHMKNVYEMLQLAISKP